MLFLCLKFSRLRADKFSIAPHTFLGAQESPQELRCKGTTILRNSKRKCRKSFAHLRLMLTDGKTVSAFSKTVSVFSKTVSVFSKTVSAFLKTVSIFPPVSTGWAAGEASSHMMRHPSRINNVRESASRARNEKLPSPSQLPCTRGFRGIQPPKSLHLSFTPGGGADDGGCEG